MNFVYLHMQIPGMCKTISESLREIIPIKCAPEKDKSLEVEDVAAGLLSKSGLKVEEWSLMKVRNGHLLEALAFRSMIAEQVLFISFMSQNKE